MGASTKFGALPIIPHPPPCSCLLLLQLTSCREHKHLPVAWTQHMTHTAPKPGLLLMKTKQKRARKMRQSHYLLQLLFWGQHTAVRFISRGLCLHTSVNMVPISPCNSSYKLCLGSVQLLSSHISFGRNSWGPNKRRSLTGGRDPGFTHILKLIN